jgi:hypothetical protein
MKTIDPARDNGAGMLADQSFGAEIGSGPDSSSNLSDQILQRFDRVRA